MRGILWYPAREVLPTFSFEYPWISRLDFASAFVTTAVRKTTGVLFNVGIGFNPRGDFAAHPLPASQYLQTESLRDGSRRSW
jgi:hypothetical protein